MGISESKTVSGHLELERMEVRPRPGWERWMEVEPGGAVRRISPVWIRWRVCWGRRWGRQSGFCRHQAWALAASE